MANNPNTIGETIRINRIKLGYTQESLANELHVSPQAISKWEKGLNMPDVNLLVPLSKVLNISVEYLLGGARYSEFDRAFEEAVPLGDKIALIVCLDALKEFPDDKTFLFRRGRTQLFLAKKEPEQKVYLNRAIADLEHLCELYPDFKAAKEMLAEAYFERGDRELAKEMAIKTQNPTLIARFTGGEEEIRFKQKSIKRNVDELLYSLLHYNSKESLDIARILVDKMMWEDKLLNANLICGLYMSEAKMCLENGDTCGFKEKITMAYELALESSKNTEKLSYTAPLFDCVYPESSPTDELGLFLNNDLLKNPDALELKKRIVADGVFTCRIMFHIDWREFFKFCEKHINRGNFSNFGTGWDLTEEQINEIGRTLMEEPKYPGNADAELRDIDRGHVERLISNRIMKGIVAQYNGDFFAYCNCKEKKEYVGFPHMIRDLKTTPDDVKVLSIMEVMVSNTYKNCGLEERLISFALEIGKKRGYTYAEIYPSENMYFTKEEFESAVELYKKLGFEIIHDISNEYFRFYCMQKKL